MTNERLKSFFKTKQMLAGGLSWTRFCVQAFKDFRSYLFIVISLFIFRIILITVFKSKMEPSSNLIDILSVMANGFRFDSRVAIYMILPTFLLSIACAFFPIDRIVDRTRLIILIGYSAMTLIICSITIPYFKEYNDQFNQWVFGLIYDDLGAIVKTAWAQVPVVKILLANIVLIFFLVLFLKRFLNVKSGWADDAKNWSVKVKIVATICGLSLLVVAARGSAGRRPVQLKDASITRDMFLNKTVLNPYESLRYLLKDFQDSRKIEGINKYLPDGDIRSAVKSFYNDCRDLQSIDEYMLRKAVGAQNIQPKHIFIIVMEGYDAWPMLDQYKSIQTSSRLKSIASEGIWIKRFLPAGIGTTQALNTIISGLPATNIMVNYQSSSSKPYPTSIAPIFQKLGYRTRFFYGGYLSWQRIGDYCRNQGFEEVYGAPHMGKWAHANEWGVDDEALFDFIAETVTDDQPSLNMIMSTSYHPPYDIEVFSLGYPVKEIPPDLEGLYDGEIDLKVFGHLWYSDMWLGKFISRMGKKLKNSVFAITGDHWSRKFLNSKPSLFERSSVPLVLYGPEILKDKHLPENAVGSHIDIAPTLIELSAPQGFAYYCIGRNLLADTSSSFAVGANCGASFVVITPDYIMENPDHPIIESFPESPPSNSLISPPGIDGRIKRSREYCAIGWWRILRGSSLPAQPVLTEKYKIE